MLPEDLLARYDPMRILGEGGYGRVVAAHDRQLDRRVAIKLLHGALDDAEAIGRFRREAAVTARIVHPHVVALLDSGVLPDGTPYLVYEHVDGSDLETVRPPREEVAEIGPAIAEALAEAHEQGVVHRDVKPANVLRRGPGDPVLADFGIARLDDAGTQFTAEGLILGTPLYIAPEVYKGRPPSPASDQFSWAASLVSLLGGGSVYGSEELDEILEVVTRPNPVRLSPAARRALGELEPVVTRALAADPKKRFRSCRDFARALRKPPPRVEASQTVRLSGDEISQASTVAIPPISAGATTTRKLLVGDGSLRALALRGLAAAGLAGLMGWAMLVGPAPPPVELPPTPTADLPPEPTDAFTEASAEFAALAEELRSYLPNDRPLGDRRPSFQGLVEFYPRVLSPELRLLWGRWLRCSERWIREATPEDLQRRPVMAQLLQDGTRVAEDFLRYVTEIKFSLQQGTTVFGTLSELKTNIRREVHPSWKMETWNDVQQDIILVTEESLCRFDRMFLDDKPEAALLLSPLASHLDLVNPSEHLPRDSPCRQTAPKRLRLYLQLLHLRAREQRELAAARPWLRGQWRLFASVSDTGLLTSSEQVRFLAEMVAHVVKIDDDAPPRLRERVWRRLILEIWRAGYRDPDSSEQAVIDLLEGVYPEYEAVAAAHPPGVHTLLLSLENLEGQNFVSEPDDLKATRPRLEALAARVGEAP